MEFRRLRERFLLLQDIRKVKPIIKKCEGVVVSRRAATDALLSPEPFYRERYRGGRWARDGEELKRSVTHGFDDQGRVTTIQDIFPTVFLYSPGFIEEIRYYAEERTASFVQHYYLDQRGRVIRQLGATSMRLFDTTHTWDGERLALSSERELRDDWVDFDDPLDPALELEPFIERLYDYGLDGELDRITLKWGSGREEIEYQRPQKRQSVNSVAKDLEAQLVELIPAALQAAAVGTPLYCVFLTYCSSGWNLPPVLCLATVKDREAFDLGDGDFDTESMWSTPELKHPTWLELNDEVLAARWSLFYQLLGTAGDFAACPKLLRRVAKRLNEQDWNATLPITDDFIVTAADTSDGVTIEEDLPPSVPPRKLSLLKKRGLWAGTGDTR